MKCLQVWTKQQLEQYIPGDHSESDLDFKNDIDCQGEIIEFNLNRHNFVINGYIYFINI